MRTNAPRLITVVIALALTLAGLSVTLVPIPVVNDLVARTGFALTHEQGWLALLASPVLLIIGSLFKGV